MDEQRARALLSAERSRVRKLLEELSRAESEDRADADQPGDFGDQAQRLTAQVTDHLLADELRQRLRAIDRAEQRIEAGTYGYSVRSGRPIPDERLEAVPAAELTVVEAQAEADRR